MTEEEKQAPVVEVVHTTNFPELLKSLRASLFVTTYQANRILICTPNAKGKISVLMRSMPRPMGLALSQKEMAVCCRSQIWFFQAVFGLGDVENSGIQHEFTFAPRKSYVTGDVAAHQAQFVNGEFHFVNTRFSCVCTLADDASFKPVWQPHFISEIAPEDRCHLNGFAYEGNRLRYATALGESDVKEGWKENKTNGGIVIDAVTGIVLSRGLSMPHSPTLYGGKLWCLESGKGRLVTIDPISGDVTEAASFPGFLRGLDFYDRFAFVGLCRIRGDKLFRGLPIEEMHDELKCGVYVFDIQSGQTVAFLEFTKGVEELFDIGFYQGAIAPHMVGFEGTLIDEVISLPSALTSP